MLRYEYGGCSGEERPVFALFVLRYRTAAVLYAPWPNSRLLTHELSSINTLGGGGVGRTEEVWWQIYDIPGKPYSRQSYVQLVVKLRPTPETLCFIKK